MWSNSIIKVEHISKCYNIYQEPIDRILSKWFPERRKEFWAVENISLEVKKGETVAIIGRNGSGKSTLLQIICGTLQPTKGSVSVRGRIAALLELGAGFDLESTGRENIYINGMLLGMSRAEIDQKFEAIATFADIGEFIERQVKTYSSGMYVRLAFAVIANSEPDVLIIDEALAVGDVFFVQKCMRFIREFKKHGTILFVSHDTSAVTNLCDRAIWIHEGKLKSQGNAKNVSEEYLAFQHARDRLIESGEDISINSESNDKLMSSSLDYVDCRADLINNSTLRNDIKVVDIGSPNNGFGTGKAKINSVSILEKGQPVNTIIGGEIVTLEIQFRVEEALNELIAGFYFKDRLGQRIFGDNTFLSYMSKPVSMYAGQIAKARFEFRMPVLPIGDYSIDVALATGNQDNHSQHHWIHDALTLKSLSSGVVTGLVGIPMIKIELVEVN